jgi:hypothetical protein
MQQRARVEVEFREGGGEQAAVFRGQGRCYEREEAHFGESGHEVLDAYGQGSVVGVSGNAFTVEG